MTTGFYQTIQGLSIEKDPEADLTYTLDWANWLPTGDSLSASSWTISTRANDPDPLLKVSNGIQGTKTYIRLNNGQDGSAAIWDTSNCINDSKEVEKMGRGTRGSEPHFNR